MKAIFIYNPNSGRGVIQKHEKYILDRLSTQYDEIVVQKTQRPQHATTLARMACGQCDTLIVAGGDGTLNEIVNGIGDQENKPVIGYIPVGTVNDLAHSIKIPCTLKKAVDNILKGKIFKHDIFKAGEKYGIYVACAGLFTEMSYSTSQIKKKKFGKIAYLFHGLKKVFSSPSFNLKLSSESCEISGRFAFILIANSRNIASFKLNRKASLNDGKVDVVLIKERRKKASIWTVLKVANLFLFGINKKKQEFEKFSITFDNPVEINLDGEDSGLTNFDFQMIKEGVEIIVPQKFHA